MIHDFLVWLRTGFNPPDIKRFRSHTENVKHLMVPGGIRFECGLFRSVHKVTKWQDGESKAGSLAVHRRNQHLIRSNQRHNQPLNS